VDHGPAVAGGNDVAWSQCGALRPHRRFAELFDIEDGIDSSGEYFLESLLALYLGDWADEV